MAPIADLALFLESSKHGSLMARRSNQRPVDRRPLADHLRMQRHRPPRARTPLTLEVKATASHTHHIARHGPPAIGAWYGVLRMGRSRRLWNPEWHDVQEDPDHGHKLQRRPPRCCFFFSHGRSMSASCPDRCCVASRRIALLQPRAKKKPCCSLCLACMDLSHPRDAPQDRLTTVRKRPIAPSLVTPAATWGVAGATDSEESGEGVLDERADGRPVLIQAGQYMHVMVVRRPRRPAGGTLSGHRSAAPVVWPVLRYHWGALGFSIMGSGPPVIRERIQLTYACSNTPDTDPLASLCRRLDLHHDEPGGSVILRGGPIMITRQ